MLGGLTDEILNRCFITWAPRDLDLAPEAERLLWAVSFTMAPTLLDHRADTDSSSLITAHLPGLKAVEDRWCAEPKRAGDAVGAGLCALHDALPVTDCPLS